MAIDLPDDLDSMKDAIRALTNSALMDVVDLEPEKYSEEALQIAYEEVLGRGGLLVLCGSCEFSVESEAETDSVLGNVETTEEISGVTQQPHNIKIEESSPILLLENGSLFMNNNGLSVTAMAVQKKGSGRLMYGCLSPLFMIVIAGLIFLALEMFLVVPVFSEELQSGQEIERQISAIGQLGTRLFTTFVYTLRSIPLMIVQSLIPLIISFGIAIIITDFIKQIIAVEYTLIIPNKDVMKVAFSGDDKLDHVELYYLVSGVEGYLRFTCDQQLCRKFGPLASETRMRKRKRRRK